MKSLTSILNNLLSSDFYLGPDFYDTHIFISAQLCYKEYKSVVDKAKPFQCIYDFETFRIAKLGEIMIKVQASWCLLIMVFKPLD